MNFVVDTFTADDWEQVHAIYREGIATGQATFEVDAPTWEQFDANHLPTCRLVARSQDQILG